MRHVRPISLKAILIILLQHSRSRPIVVADATGEQELDFAPLCLRHLEGNDRLSCVHMHGPQMQCYRLSRANTCLLRLDSNPTGTPASPRVGIFISQTRVQDAVQQQSPNGRSVYVKHNEPYFLCRFSSFVHSIPLFSNCLATAFVVFPKSHGRPPRCPGVLQWPCLSCPRRTNLELGQPFK